MNSLQSSWVKRLYNDCFQECKIISLYQLNKLLGPSFKFDSNVSFKKSSLTLFRWPFSGLLMDGCGKKAPPPPP